MIAAAVLFILTLIAIAYYSVKYAHKYYLKYLDAQGNVDRMEKRNMLLDTKLQFVAEHQQEMFWAAKAKGEAKGYKEMLMHLPQLYNGVSEMQKGLYAEFGKDLAEKEGLKLNAKVHQDSYQSVRQINEKYKRDLEEMQNKLIRIQEERNDAIKTSNKHLDLYKQEKAKNIPQTPQKSIGEGIQRDYSDAPGQDLDTYPGLIKPLSDPFQRQLEYQVKDSDKHYFEVIDERTVGVYRKETGVKMAQFAPMNLTKGVPWDLGGIKVLLCILDDCNIVSFTTQPGTMACCKVHRDQHYYKKRFIQTS